MKRIKLLLYITLLLFISCKSSNKEEIKNSDFSYDYLINKIKESESELNKVNCDYASVKKYIETLDSNSIASIPIAEKIVIKCIPNLDSAKRDELFVIFNTFINKVSDNITDSLEIKYDSITNKLYENIDDAEIKEFKKCLDLCNLQLAASEGTFYIELKYDYCYNLFKKKVSPALEEYLRILSIDKHEQFDEDAALLVSFDEVYKRVIVWEDFINKYHGFVLHKEAKDNFNTYLTILLTGEENTPAFDYENGTLMPDLKTLFEKIISKDEGRRSTKIISEYFNYLKGLKFKQPENTENFLKRFGIE